MSIFFAATQFAIFLRVLSSILLLFFCIPLQIKEARVKNGLRVLRLQLLAFGIVLFFTNIFSLYFLFDIVLHQVPQRSLNVWLQAGNALAFLFLAIIGHLIYHQNYTEENKQLHEKIDKTTG